ncbi:MAG: hypothetical protein JWO51_3771 [Rhodospirillales bacterium]|jgi:hypothetical protein|nr:hypothetical protein [Rhodospirillales bacterium]
MDDARPAARANDAVAAYKIVLQQVLDNRPSGTRQRLASALGKNRSFISQITSPAYAVPIPQRHLETIFEICHFPPEDKRRFLELYHRAHPRRGKVPHEGRRMRAHSILLPDLGSDDRNRQLEALVAEFVNGLARLIDDH